MKTKEPTKPPAKSNSQPVELKPFLKKERDYTDESLNTERDKTDDSLFDLRKTAERETDAKVKRDRKQADESRAQVRSEKDSNVSASMGLKRQRSEDDKVIETERLKVDVAIERERTQKDRVLTEFLKHERGETDTNLGNERDKTDQAVDQSSKLLTQEVSRHSQTKQTLTSRDELIAIVSHDLKNPIGAILSCSDMLLADPSYSEMGTELKYWIELIKRNAQTSIRLINDILDMERVSEGKLDVKVLKQSLSKVVREAADHVVPIATANRILIKLPSASQETIATFDRDRIAQVLSNLIGNALKFTPEGGTISLAVNETEADVIVAISDTGIGIPSDQHEQIFKRYTQIGKQDRRGIGLGLYISKMLVESHNGRIWVTSELNRGSTFHFSLPKTNKV